MEVATCVRIVYFRDLGERCLFVETDDELRWYVVLSDDKVLVCLYVKGKSTWKLECGDIILRMNVMH